MNPDFWDTLYNVFHFLSAVCDTQSDVSITNLKRSIAANETTEGTPSNTSIQSSSNTTGKKLNSLKSNDVRL